MLNMKNILLIIISILGSVTITSAQDTLNKSQSASDGFFGNSESNETGSKLTRGQLKKNDWYFPRWSLDVSYKYGRANNDITFVNMANELNASGFPEEQPNINFTKGRIHSLGLEVGYFFGKKRRFGIGTGINWSTQTGSLTFENPTNSIYEYQANDRNNNSIFRQILTINGNVEETVNTQQFMIPLLLKFKHQFDKEKFSKFGIAINAGALFGIWNQNKISDVNANFNYEAIYKYNANGTPEYDNTAGVGQHSSTSEIITEDYWTQHPTGTEIVGNVDAYFDRKFLEGMNVGLRKAGKLSDDQSSYSSVPGVGFIFQPSITYQLNYNVAFVLGGYYSYQVLNNENKNKYQMTGDVGTYNSLTNGITKNVIQSYGMNIGFRFFFGEKADRDGDLVLDVDDKCPRIPGKKNLAGCPDSDDDGVKDEDDKCKDEYGSKDCAGCPDDDNDLIANREDACPNEPGVGSSIPKYNGCPLVKMFAEQAEALGYTKANAAPPPQQIEDYFEVLQKDFINFEYGKSFVLPSNLIVLDKAVSIMQSNPNLVMLVSGHTDNVGTFATNMKLSLERANAVKGYLVSKGVDKDRIVTVGYAYERPISDNNSEQGRATNRRTEMKLLSPLKPKK